MKSNCSNKQQQTTNKCIKQSADGIHIRSHGRHHRQLWAAFETLSGTAMHCIKSGTTKRAENDSTITTVMGSVTKMGILAETDMYSVF